MYSIVSLRSFTTALSDVFLYATYPKEFRLSGPDSDVIRTALPSSSPEVLGTAVPKFQKRVLLRFVRVEVVRTGNQPRWTGRVFSFEVLVYISESRQGET